MPSVLSYPGVYVEEVPSGVRTIVGIPTSVTAFIGRAQRGAVNRATIINSFADYQRLFGGLWNQSSMSFSVRDFFQNGGGQAVVVRLFHPGGEDAEAAIEAANTVAAAAAVETKGSDAKDKAKAAKDAIDADADSVPAAKAGAAKALAIIDGLADNADAEAVKKAAAQAAASSVPIRRKIKVGNLDFIAANPGRWSAYLQVEIERTPELGSEAPATEKFNLTVRDPNGATERFVGLTLKPGGRRVDRVLAAESGLIAWAGVDLDEEDPPKLPELGKDDKNKAIPVVIADEVTTAYLAWRDSLKGKDPNSPDAKTKRDKYQAALKEVVSAVSDGDLLEDADFLSGDESGDAGSGINALEQLFARDGIFNLLVIPPYNAAGDVGLAVVAAASAYCEKRRAMLLLDAPAAWKTKGTARDEFTDPDQDKVGTRSRNAALFFPRIRQPNPLREGQIETFSATGTVAGVIARTDAQRGVWKSPAGLDAGLVGVTELHVKLTDEENGELNPLGINCLRSFPVYGRVVWGARTLRGADSFADEYKYLAVRRTALYIEESLFRGLKWVVFEPNDEPLWAQIRLNVGAFMHDLFRKGAFQGRSPREAYFVNCDSTTTTQSDINHGIVNINVGFAPLKPAEFVVIRLQQIAGQLEA
ncbi:phage tail sheath family protein [Ensifer canadensis]